MQHLNSNVIIADTNGKGDTVMNHKYCCPYCGNILDIINGKVWNHCTFCEIDIDNPIKSQYESQYYIEMAEKVFPQNVFVNGNSGKFRWREILISEISKNPLFDEERYKRRTNSSSEIINTFDLVQRNKNKENQPKCPTCNSSDIQKISTTSKVIGASLFGLLSKNVTSQFKCNNCGYKW